MKLILPLFLLIISTLGVAQEPLGAAACVKGKQFLAEKRVRYNGVVAESDSSIDVSYYKLNLTIDPAKQSLVASTTILFLPKKTVSTCYFSLTNSLTIDSIVIDTKKIAFQHQNGQVQLTLDKSYSANSKVTAIVYYQGKPPKNANEAFNFTTHGSTNFPVVWSLSEPFGAADWWVCKNDLSDKADSSDVWITMPSAYVSVSNGILEKKETKGTQTTYRWKNRYPIADYLISIACTNYTEYTNHFTDNQQNNLLITHFIYPENFTQTIKNQLDETVPIMAYLSEKFGIYPFMKEKYGHAQFGYGGGMEHQTCSSMGAFDADLVAHEMAHQWFGDKVTCKTWEDIWVNEGFATYAEMLYAETKGNYNSYLDYYMKQAKLAKGTIAVQNTSSINQIFSFERTYCKGAVVLHTLRRVVGDEVFFRILKNYLTTYAYKMASIRDFQQVAEKEYGRSLAAFFDAWLYGTGYPKFEYGWQTNNNQLSLQINQLPSEGTTVFRLPLEVGITFANNKDTTLIVDIISTTNLFSLPLGNVAIQKITLDPRNSVLKDVKQVAFGVLANESSDADILLYPNPAVEVVVIQCADIQKYTLSVVDAAGRTQTVRLLDSNQLSVQHLPSGKYWVVLQSASNLLTKAFVKE